MLMRDDAKMRSYALVLRLYVVVQISQFCQNLCLPGRTAAFYTITPSVFVARFRSGRVYYRIGVIMVMRLALALRFVMRALICWLARTRVRLPHTHTHRHTRTSTRFDGPCNRGLNCRCKSWDMNVEHGGRAPIRAAMR